MKRREVISHLLVRACPDSQRWYAKYIGWVFPNFGFTAGEYMTCTPDGYINFIQEEDCEDIGFQEFVDVSTAS